MGPDLLDSLVQSAVAALPEGARARPKAPPSVLRLIAKEDLPGLLSGARERSPEQRPMERLRNTHHLAAKQLAEGKSLEEVSLITGYTAQRLCQLKADPAFANLVEHYKKQVDGKWLNVHERLASLGVALTEEIQSRLEENPDGFSNEELRKTAETLLDRSGFGPKSTRDVNVRSQNLTLSLIEQVKREAGENSNVKLLEG